MSLYAEYVESIKRQLGRDELTFKSDPSYQYMLEHSNYGHMGLKILEYIKNEFKLTSEEIARFTVLNDSFGKPELSDYGVIPLCSPTSLRYVYHAHIILNHMKKLGITHPRITEIGGGYGGLCSAIHVYASKFGVNPVQYNIIDLEFPGKLQKRVLDMYDYPSINYYNAENFGSEIVTNDDGFLISTYAFSEISSDLREKYVDILFPKISHGVIVWNAIPVYDIGKQIRVEDERPLSGELNKFVFF